VAPFGFSEEGDRAKLKPSVQLSGPALGTAAGAVSRGWWGNIALTQSVSPPVGRFVVAQTVDELCTCALQAVYRESQDPACHVRGCHTSVHPLIYLSDSRHARDALPERPPPARSI
jgi:hypothetical protein